MRSEGSVVEVPRLWNTGPVVVAQGFRCSVVCGILLDQGLNPCLLHQQVDSLPLSPSGFHIAVVFTLTAIVLSNVFLTFVASPAEYLFDTTQS